MKEYDNEGGNDDASDVNNDKKSRNKEKYGKRKKYIKVEVDEKSIKIRMKRRKENRKKRSKKKNWTEF